MLRHPVYNLHELNNSLILLRKDLIAISEFDDRIPIPILFQSKATLSNVKKQDEKSRYNVERVYYIGSFFLFNSIGNTFRANEHNYNKILETLIASNFYLNHLSKERSSFDTLLYGNGASNGESNGADDVNKENDEPDVFTSVTNLKDYFEMFKEKAWKCFAEVSVSESYKFTKWFSHCKSNFNLYV